MDVWDQLMLEPRWFAIIGLGMDLIGGATIASAAWLRLRLAVDPIAIGVGVTGIAEEAVWAWRWRRRAVIDGGILLSAGFLLQMYSAWLLILR